MAAATHHFAVGADDEGRRLDVFLAGRLPGLSRSPAQRLIREQRVTVDGASAKASAPVESGSTVTVAVPPATDDAPAAEPLPLTVLYDDDALAVIEKPAGMVVHPGAGHAAGTLVNALQHHLSGLSGIGGRPRPGLFQATHDLTSVTNASTSSDEVSQLHIRRDSSGVMTPV